MLVLTSVYLRPNQIVYVFASSKIDEFRADFELNSSFLKVLVQEGYDDCRTV